MCKLPIYKTWVTSLLAVSLAVAGNSFLPFTHKASFAGEISQTNEPERAPDGQIVPVNGQVNVRLTNKTNDQLFYQVVAQTNRRSLEENSTVALQALISCCAFKLYISSPDQKSSNPLPRSPSDPLPL